jgi:hypothetical protein
MSVIYTLEIARTFTLATRRFTRRVNPTCLPVPLDATQDQWLGDACYLTCTDRDLKKYSSPATRGQVQHRDIQTSIWSFRIRSHDDVCRSIRITAF